MVNHSFLFSTGEPAAERDAKNAAERMRHFLQDPSRDVQEPYFTVSEFLDWLFSKAVSYTHLTLPTKS